jgi:three-Cys-motif partner protein
MQPNDFAADNGSKTAQRASAKGVHTMTDFFDRFHDATLTKLEILNLYIQEWLPVFLNKGVPWSRVHVIDFFSGPGQDHAGNRGTPLLLVDGVQSYCKARSQNRNQARVCFHFNDEEPSHIAALQAAIATRPCVGTCCEFYYSTEDFGYAFPRIFRGIEPGAPALVLLDPFGFDVSIEIIREVAQRRHTDMLLFFPSSTARRFSENLDLPGKLHLTDEERVELRESDHYHAHRVLGRLIEKKITTPEYMVAPFSIRKGPNIHGIFFGSSNMLGIEKFLTICWKVAPKTGEANYNIDREPRQLPLFAEETTPTKRDRFAEELCSFIREESPTNCELTHFCYRSGFSKQKAKEVLLAMTKAGEIVVWDNAEKKPARRNAFYLGHEHCQNDPAKVTFFLREDAPHV